MIIIYKYILLIFINIYIYIYLYYIINLLNHYHYISIFWSHICREQEKIIGFKSLWQGDLKVFNSCISFVLHCYTLVSPHGRSLEVLRFIFPSKFWQFPRNFSVSACLWKCEPSNILKSPLCCPKDRRTSTLLWLVTTRPDFPPALVALWCPHMSDLRACAPQCRSCRDAAGTTGLQRLGQASDTKMLPAEFNLTISHYSLDRNVSLTCAAPADWWFENTAVDTVLVEKQRPSHNLWCPNIGTFHGMPSWNSEFSITSAK